MFRLILPVLIVSTMIPAHVAQAAVVPATNVRSAYFDRGTITPPGFPHYLDLDGRDMPQLPTDFHDRVLASIPLSSLVPGDVLDFGYDYEFSNEMKVGTAPTEAATRVVNASVQTRLVLATSATGSSGAAVSPWQIGAFDRTNEHHRVFSDRGAFTVPTGYSGGYLNIVGRAKLLDPPKAGESCYARQSGSTLVLHECAIIAEQEWSSLGLSRLTTATLDATPATVTATSTNGVSVRLRYSDVIGAGAEVVDSRQDAHDAQRVSTLRLPSTLPYGGDVYPVAWTKVTASAGDALRIDGQIGSRLPTGTPASCTNFVGGEIVLSNVAPVLASQSRTSLENAATTVLHTRAGGSNLVGSQIFSGALAREGLLVVPQAGTYWIALYAYQLSTNCNANSVNISRQRTWVTATRYFAQSSYALSFAARSASTAVDGAVITGLASRQPVTATCVHAGDVFRVFATELFQISTGQPEILLGINANAGGGDTALIWNSGDSNDDGRGRYTGVNAQLYRGATAIGVYSAVDSGNVTFVGTVEAEATMTGSAFAKGDPYNRISYLQYAGLGPVC